MSTPYHARYFAHTLSRKQPPGSDDRLSASLFDAAVDLNPHQIDAALFTLQSPLSKGVLLADEVGLGKTIEAGLVLCQLWAERRRRLLVICPASLRKQWSQELDEKFHLPTRILDSRSWKQAIRDGITDPLGQDGVVIVSTNYAARISDALAAAPWNLIVIDEAHKLRNSYRPKNKMGYRIRTALQGRRKVLLTATPLQNSLMELYGLTTLADENLFGDDKAFRAEYNGHDADLKDLRRRLAPVCKRTLRKDVTEYIRYTERKALTRPFRPTNEEHRLYEALSAFFRREDTYAIPRRQRTLTTLILRKLLASSSYAIVGTLDTMIARLKKLRAGLEDGGLIEGLMDPGDMEDEILEELEEDEDDGAAPEVVDPAALETEIRELEQFRVWAAAITVDEKSRALLSALSIGFEQLEQMGANRKALLFTESRRTQDYLKAFLEANGYAGRVVLFNGSNTGPEAKATYAEWEERNQAAGGETASRDVGMRAALIEHFRDKADIMIATEAGAEGVNLQFCSLVINYDLPWNPQRIEQRIGRCHRYGQRFDVVVINFYNERNDADKRVLELLTEKFHLFSGVFGASDEVLGRIESGVDFEKKVLAIYQECRTSDEIQAAFEHLQEEMDASIKARMAATRRMLLEHFDEDVHQRLRDRLDETRVMLDAVGRMFWSLTRFILRDRACFDDVALAFDLHRPPISVIPDGRYQLVSRSVPLAPGAMRYRLAHPLGEHVLSEGKDQDTPPACLTFDVSGYQTRLSDVEQLIGKAGWLTVQRLTIESFESEEYVLFSAFEEGGTALADETCEKLFRCHAAVEPLDAIPDAAAKRLAGDATRHAEATIARSMEANGAALNQERERLDRWARDKVKAAENALDSTKAALQTLDREARVSTTVEDQLRIQNRISEMERRKRRQRQEIFDVEDEAEEQRKRLIAALERRLRQKTSTESLFTIRWVAV